MVFSSLYIAMDISLPSGDMGSKNLPVPVSPSLPAGLGDRELASSPKIKDGLEPIIMSLDLLNDTVDSISSVVSESDMSRLTVADLDKLFEKYLSKNALADSITYSLIRQSPPALDSSLMVRQQLKANEVIRKQPSGDFNDIFSKKSSSSKSSSSGGGASLVQGYNKVIDTAHTAVTNPLQLVDKLIPALLGIFDKKKKDTSGKSSEKSKKSKEEPFYGKGEVEEDFYGSFSNRATQAVGFTLADSFAAGGGGRGDGPVGSITDPIYTLSAGKDQGIVSTEDNIQEEAARVGIEADKALEATLENPDQSSFANFVSGGDGGGGGGKKKGKDKEAGQPGIGMVLIAGMILTALILFKDVVEKVFDKVIIPFGELLIDFLRALKDPLIAFAEAFISVAIVYLDIIKEILVAVKPYLIQVAEVLAGTVVVVLGVIKGVLEVLKEPLITIVGLLGEIVVKVVGAVLDLVTILTMPLKLVAGILQVTYPHIIRIADFVGGVIADWFEENEDFVKDLLTSVGDLVKTITEKLKEFLGNLDLSGVAKTLTAVSNVIGSFAEGVGDVLTRVFSGIFAGIQSALTDLGAFFAWFRNSRVGKALNMDDESASARELAEMVRLDEAADRRRENELAAAEVREARLSKNQVKDQPIFTGLVDVLSTDVHEKGGVEELLRGIYKDTTLIANILFESNKSLVPIINARVKPVDDLIITSAGDVFETAPTDSIMAIQNGSVSIQPTSPVNSLSDSRLPVSGSSKSSSQGGVTNVYSSSTSVDANGINPFSEFCPVGV